MSDTNEQEIVFEEPTQDADDFEVQVLKEGEAEPVAPAVDPNAGKVQMTMAEFEALQKQKDSTATLAAGLGQLVEKISQPVAPVNVQAPVQDTYDPAKLEQDLFATGKSIGTIEAVVNRQLGGLQAQLMQGMVQQNRQMLQINPKTATLFTQYEKEIDALVASAPPQARLNPTIYEQAYKQVVSTHQEDIIEQRVQARLAEAAKVAPAAQKAGTVQRTPVFNETGGASPTTVKKQVYIKQSQVQAMLESGLDPKDKDQVKQYLAYQKELGR